jgi:uncharacterized protein (TIGR02246 family)
MKNHLFAVVAFVVGVVVGYNVVATVSEPNGVVVTSGPVYEGQKKLLESFVTAFKAGDAKGCANLYTEDTVYMLPELQIQKGRETVLAGYQDDFKNRSHKVIELVEPIEGVISFGDWAAIRGTGKTVKESQGGVRTTEAYKYVILSQKQPDGSWQMKWDIFNFDADYNTE